MGWSSEWGIHPKILMSHNSITTLETFKTNFHIHTTYFHIERRDLKLIRLKGNAMGYIQLTSIRNESEICDATVFLGRIFTNFF